MPVPMPVAFFGHGSPMNTLELNRHTARWRDFGDMFAAGEHSRSMNEAGLYAKPRAILCISAHWAPLGGSTEVQVSEQPEMIHDYMGFPRELQEFRYPASGATNVALRVADLLRPMCAPKPIARTTRWGVDHGTWSVLAHVFPNADVPVAQLSIDLSRPAEWHLEAGRKLTELRLEGVLIVGSGNIVHNLGRMNMSAGDQPAPEAARFNEYIVNALRNNDEEALCNYANHPDVGFAVPTPEHFLPLLYVVGARNGQSPGIITDGYDFGSISMTSFFYGVNSAKHQPANAAY